MSERCGRCLSCNSPVEGQSHCDTCCDKTDQDSIEKDVIIEPREEIEEYETK